MTHIHRTREGQRMLVTEMSDRHLKNTIAFWERKLAPYLAEAERRGISPKPPVHVRFFRFLKGLLSRGERRTHSGIHDAYDQMILDSREDFDDIFMH